jgi:hypothetical protein
MSNTHDEVRPVPAYPLSPGAHTVAASRAPSSLAFPKESLVGSIGDLARVLAHGTEVPEEFYFAAGLTLVGLLCGTRLGLNIGFTVEPRLYTVLLGESYSVKKSTALKKTIDFFNGLALQVPPTVVYGVGSAEGLARELVAKPNLLIAFDELRALVDKCQVKGSTLLPIVTSLFEGNRWHNAVKSKKGSVSVDDAHLSLLACCTLDTYADVWKQDAIAIGLPNRLFVVNADHQGKVAWPAKADATQLAQIGERVKTQIASLPRELDITPEAKMTWAHWYCNLPSSQHTARLDTIGLRLLALIALTTDKRAVDIATVSTVAAILNYEFELRVLTDPIDADSTIAKLEEKIRRHLRKGPLPERKLRQTVHADRAGLWAFDKALKNLQKVSGEIQLRDGCWSIIVEEAARWAA